MAREDERREVLGVAGVDSGCLMVVDPCSVDRDPESIPGGWTDGLPQAEWQEPFLAAIGQQIAEGQSDVPCVPVRVGIVFGTQLGDGQYPVVAVYDAGGALLRVEIVIAEAAGGEPDFPDHEDDAGLSAIPIVCPACGKDDTLSVAQTNGSYALIAGRGSSGYPGDYAWVGMALGPDGTQPPYSDELVDQTDEQGNPILHCHHCGHEWPDLAAQGSQER